MNSSQNATLAIRNHIERRLVFLRCFPLCILLTLQGCSTIEEIFSPTETPGVVELKKDSTEADQEVDSLVTPDSKKAKDIHDLKASNQLPLKPLQQTRRSELDSSAALEPQKLRTIEIMWQVPTEPVETYHIFLENGVMDPSDNKKHFRVPVSILTKEDDPTYGPVYKYVIPGGQTANSIQIKAENRFGLSEPSEPIIVGK